MTPGLCATWRWPPVWTPRGGVSRAQRGDHRGRGHRPAALERVHRLQHKGAALAHYCDLAGIDIADTVAFGDNENDIEMLRLAGTGVAMGNALEPVQGVADIVTADNDSDGIALVLAERFGLG